MGPVSRQTTPRATHAAPPGGDQDSVLRLGLRLQAYPEIESAVEQALTDDGEIAPDATPELARLLRLRVTVKERLRERMDALAQSYFARGYLQDPLVVERGGRMCLPVLATHQGRFQGIVHDRSGSGATLFMEPLAVVPQGNELRDTELAVEEEFRKILADLSALVGQSADAIEADLRRLTALDVIFAKGRLALLQDAHCPEIAAYLDLPDARHPLLGRQAVPIDFHLGDAQGDGVAHTTLVITGPNTGGKTVALKTVGLLALLAQSGLHLPAGATCKVPVFPHIFADIGDEQSLEQSLSTFSGHMSQIVKILSRVQAAARSGEGPVLVLLDEIGAGTDPTEGTALAQAILEALPRAGDASRW
jgi:DNA mismatch repair protein MutS2